MALPERQRQQGLALLIRHEIESHKAGRMFFREFADPGCSGMKPELQYVERQIRNDKLTVEYEASERAAPTISGKYLSSGRLRRERRSVC